MTKEEIACGFERVGLSLSEIQIGKFYLYATSLVEWNLKANLISKNDEARILDRHFIESAALSLYSEFSGQKSILDLGTGAGFPGIPLKLICPEIELSLLDSKQKKVVFLKKVTEQLKVQANVFWGRAEDLALEEKVAQKFDVVVSRAVARLTQLFKWAKPFLKKSGCLITIKGSRAIEEIEELKNKQKSLAIELRDFPIKMESTKNLKVVVVKSNE